MIKIRQAIYEDIPRIMQFIDEHWKKDHILAIDRTMFEFQHVRDGEVFYIIAEDDTDGKIYGTMGYIPMAEEEWSCMSTVMIRSLKNPEQRLLGEEMARYFEKNMKCYNVFSVGVEKRYAQVIKKLGGACIERLKHYYLLGECKDFKIARIEEYKKPEVLKSDAQLVELSTIEDFKNKVNLEVVHKDYPRRSINYIQHRYYEHPYYSYHLFGIDGKEGVQCVIVVREESLKQRKILRIVDLFGKDSELQYAGDAINELLSKGQYEYIDFYCYGIDEKVLLAAGFVERTENDKNIIPNYFDPFVQENVEIYFYTWYLPNIHVYRGFGDQDRPNHVTKERGI